jgi:RNA ligase
MSIHYPFPIINHISDVLPFIDDKSFTVKEKDSGHTFINYVRMGPETFPPVIGSVEERHAAVIRRECRGIAFYTETGLIASRPFHKFFNVGENEYVTIGHLGFHMPHVVMDKVDGSMVRPLLTPAGLRWGTKIGVTDTSNFAEAWLYGKREYVKFALRSVSEGWTPLFEYVSPENRVVVNYGKRDMILLAMRHTVTGEYMDHDAMVLVAERYGIPVVKTYDPIEGDAQTYIENVRISDDLDEGVVVAWPNGHRSKAKTDIYNVLHKVKEAGRTERTLVTAILEGKVDDLLSMLEDKDRAKVDAFIAEFWSSLDTLENEIGGLYEDVRGDFPDKKSFALGRGKDLTRIERANMFSLWDGKVATTRDAAMNIIKSGLTSETNWFAMRNSIEEAESFTAFSFDWTGQEDIE